MTNNGFGPGKMMMTEKRNFNPLALSEIDAKEKQVKKIESTVPIHAALKSGNISHIYPRICRISRLYAFKEVVAQK